MQLKCFAISLLLLLCLGANAQAVMEYKSFHDKGRLLVLEGKYDDAVHAFDSAIGIMPYYSTIFQDRGYAHLQLGNYSLSINDFNRVLREKPYLNEVLLRRGIAYFNLGQLDLAEKDLQAVVKAEPLKTQRAKEYLEYIRQAKQQRNSATLIEADKLRLERERIRQAREREQAIWGTAVPLAFWTSVFLVW